MLFRELLRILVLGRLRAEAFLAARVRVWSVSHRGHPLRGRVDDEVRVPKLIVLATGHDHDAILRRIALAVRYGGPRLVVTKSWMLLRVTDRGGSRVGIIVDVRLLDLARMDIRCAGALGLHDGRRCGCLVRRGPVEGSLCEALQGSWVTGRIRCDVWIVDDECVDIIVRDDVRDNFLVFFRSGDRSSPRSLLLLSGRAAVTGCASGTTSTAALLRNRTLEDDLGSLARLMLERLAQHLCLALLLGLVVEVEDLGRLSGLAWLLRMGCCGCRAHTWGTSLQGRSV